MRSVPGTDLVLSRLWWLFGGMYSNGGQRRLSVQGSRIPPLKRRTGEPWAYRLLGWVGFGSLPASAQAPCVCAGRAVVGRGAESGWIRRETPG